MRHREISGEYKISIHHHQIVRLRRVGASKTRRLLGKLPVKSLQRQGRPFEIDVADARSESDCVAASLMSSTSPKPYGNIACRYVLEDGVLNTI